MNAGIFIPIVAIVATFAVPITAIVMDFRRRKLQSEERRAMIERGMVPPALEESSGFGSFRRDPAARRERSLFAGVTMLFLGAGLLVAAWLLQNVISASFMPPRLAGPLTVGGVVVLFLGIGNLVYYAVTAKRGSGDAR